MPGAVQGGEVAIRYGNQSGPYGRSRTSTQNTEDLPGSSEGEDLSGYELRLGA